MSVERQHQKQLGTQIEEMPPLPSCKSELLTDPKHLREDCQMIRRAVRERWGLDTIKPELIARLSDIIKKEATKDRTVLATAKVLIEMDRDNVAAENGPQAPTPGIVNNVTIANPLDAVAEQVNRLRQGKQNTGEQSNG